MSFEILHIVQRRTFLRREARDSYSISLTIEVTLDVCLQSFFEKTSNCPLNILYFIYIISVVWASDRFGRALYARAFWCLVHKTRSFVLIRCKVLLALEDMSGTR